MEEKYRLNLEKLREDKTVENYLRIAFETIEFAKTLPNSIAPILIAMLKEGAPDEITKIRTMLLSYVLLVGERKDWFSSEDIDRMCGFVADMAAKLFK